MPLSTSSVCWPSFGAGFEDFIVVPGRRAFLRLADGGEPKLQSFGFLGGENRFADEITVFGQFHEKTQAGFERSVFRIEIGTVEGIAFFESGT